LDRVRGQARRCETSADSRQRPLLVPVLAFGRFVAGVVCDRIGGMDDQKNALVRVRPVLSTQPKCRFTTSSGEKNTMILKA